MKIREMGEGEVEEGRALLVEFNDNFQEDLGFQSIDEEIRTFPLKYASPKGAVLLAKVGDQVAGMVCIYPFSDLYCEMKRLYVNEQYRGLGIGNQLVKEIITKGKALGYKGMILDTLKQLKAALACYARFGFEPCAPYYDNPLPDVLYMKLDWNK